MSIKVLRSKGLSDDEIQATINSSASRLIERAYSVGFREGVKTCSQLIELATTLDKYRKQTDLELMS